MIAVQIGGSLRGLPELAVTQRDARLPIEPSLGMPCLESAAVGGRSASRSGGRTPKALTGRRGLISHALCGVTGRLLGHLGDELAARRPGFAGVVPVKPRIGDI